MKEGTGKDLLLAWFRPLPETPNTSRPGSRQEGDFLSISSSKVNSTITSPKEGNRNRSNIMSFEKVL